MTHAATVARYGYSSSEPSWLPVGVVKEYYWCPVSAYYRIVLWAERQTESMAAGAAAGEYRSGLVEALEEWGLRARELLWEHPVESGRLGLRGRVDLAAITVDERLVVVEAKLSLPAARIPLHVQAQVAAYGVAAEETLRLPLETMLVYSVEDRRLVELKPSPRLRRLVEEAVEALREALEKGEPPEPRGVPGWRCRLCSYRGLCPHRRG